MTAELVGVFRVVVGLSFCVDFDAVTHEVGLTLEKLSLRLLLRVNHDVHVVGFIDAVTPQAVVILSTGSESGSFGFFVEFHIPRVTGGAGLGFLTGSHLVLLVSLFLIIT